MLKGGPSVAKGDCLKCFISAVGCPPRTICSAIDSPEGPFLWGTSYSMTGHPGPFRENSKKSGSVPDVPGWLATMNKILCHWSVSLDNV